MNLNYSSKKIIIFDYDDTLVLTKDISYLLHEQVCSELDLKMPSKDDFYYSLGVPWSTVIKKFWPGTDIEKFKKRYHDRIEQLSIPLNKGLIETLKTLIQRGYEIMILSSKRRIDILRELKDSDFPRGIIKKIYGCEDTLHHKPNGRVFDELINEYNCVEKDVVYIGDSLMDLTACKERGIDFIGITTGFCTREEFEMHGQQVIIEKLEELLDFFKKE